MLRGLPLIHPKLGSTLESWQTVRAAVKPSDEPLRKGETVRPLTFALRIEAIAQRIDDA